jgi:imidazolonepropionase-like amidohydrolase
VLKKAHAKGVKIIAGSDAEEPYQTPGFSLIEELKWIQKAGFINTELLTMVTTNAAAFFKGYLPKIQLPNTYILINKNPLENIDNLKTVTHIIINGKIIDCASLANSLK